MLKFHGLNASKKAIDDFSIDLASGELKIESLSSDFFLTFDSVYRLANLESGHCQLLVLDQGAKSFRTLKSFNQASRSVQACSSTNYLWCLASNLSHSQLALYQFMGSELVHEYNLSSVVKSNDQDELIMAATDINLYLFATNKEIGGLRCVYELNGKTKLSENRQKQEEQFSESSTCSLPLNTLLIEEKVEKVVGGKEHLLVLTTQAGQVYSCGLGTKGQLGHGAIENFYELKRIDGLFQKRIKIIAAGGWHSGCIDDEGDCYMWGWNSHGQTGVVDAAKVFIAVPTKLEILDDQGRQVKFKHLSLGARHSILVDDRDNIYTFGWNKYGQLLQTDLEPVIEQDDEDESVCEPVQVERYNGRVKDAMAGSWSTVLLLASHHLKS